MRFSKVYGLTGFNYITCADSAKATNDEIENNPGNPIRLACYPANQNVVLFKSTYRLGVSNYRATLYRDGAAITSVSSVNMPADGWRLMLEVRPNMDLAVYGWYCENKSTVDGYYYLTSTTSKIYVSFGTYSPMYNINSDNSVQVNGDATASYGTGNGTSRYSIGNINDLGISIDSQKAINYAGYNGTISGPSTASSGKTVTLTVTPDTGYVFSSLAVYKSASQEAVNYTKVDDITYTFVMPDADVTVNAIFVRAYTVSISCSPSTAGVITRTPSTELVRPGLTVRFTVSPNDGWQISTMDFSQDAAVDWDADTLTGTFTMPERLVYGTIYLSSTEDPNASGGTSQPEIPSGGFDNESDIISIPVSSDTGVASQSVGKGLITIWNPTVDEVADIGQYLYATDWGDALYQGFRDFFVKPLESAISLHVLPIRPTRSSAKKKIMFGPHNSNVSSYQVINQYSTIDLGRLKIEPYWDSYLDYNPFTKIQIFLPFIGTQDLDADIVMGKTIGVRYKFDILTGACVAFLYTMEDNTPSIFAEFVGESAMQIPLCSSDYSRVIGGVIQAAATVVTGRAVTNAVSNRAQQAVNAAGDEVGKAMVQMDNAKNLPNGKNGRPTPAKNTAIKAARLAQEKADKGLAIATQKAGEIRATRAAAEWQEAPYVVSNVVSGKVSTTISGSVAGGAGLLGSQIPYLIIRRPKQSLPDNYRRFVGYPSNIYAILGSLSGFTRIEQADLKDIPCTDAELAMIYKALKEGVYL